MKRDKNIPFANLPPVAGEYICLVIKKMGYRRKVREEVQAELIAHFEDAIEEYKAKSEALNPKSETNSNNEIQNTKQKAIDEKVRKIIEEFGDAKLLGILARRAKKRCRPLYRQVIARFFQFTGIVILLFIVYIVWFLLGTPNITTDYMAELNKTIRPVADESLNSASYYQKAAQLHKQYIDETFKEQNDRTKFGVAISQTSPHLADLDPNQQRIIIAALNNPLNKQAMEFVIQGSEKPYYWCEYKTGNKSSNVLAMLMPPLSEYRNIARLLLWQTRIDIQNNNYDAAIKNIIATYRLGFQQKQGATLIEYLAGVAFESFTTRAIRGILTFYDLDDEHLKKLYTDLSTCASEEKIIPKGFDCEKITLYDVIQRSFSDDFTGGHLLLYTLRCLQSLVSQAEHISTTDELSKEISMVIKKGPHVLFTHPDRKTSFEMADAYWEFWKKSSATTPATIRKDEINFDEQAQKIIRGNILLEVLVPATSRVLELGWRNKADTDATLCIIALIRYHKHFGNYPDSLDKLIETGYLKQVPMDPWSDKPFVYKKMDNNFTLYSVGSNFFDDGGTPAYDKKGIQRMFGHVPYAGDAVFWPVPKEKSNSKN